MATADGGLQANKCERAALYDHASKLGRIVASRPFNNLGLVVTTCFVVWMAVDMDMNAAGNLADAAPVFQAFHWLFSVFFLVEAILRSVALQQKCQIWKSPALVWDVILAITLIVSGFTSVDFSIVQITRIIRLLCVVPELQVLLQGLFIAARATFCCIMLLTCILYSFSIAMHAATGGTNVDEKHFSTVPLGMYTLLIRGCFLQGSDDLADALLEESPGGLVLFFLFVVLALTVLVMTAGVICETVHFVASKAKNEMTAEYLTEALLKIPSAYNMFTSPEHFISALEDLPVACTLQGAGLDLQQIKNCSSAIFKGQSYSSLEELMMVLVRFQPGQAATYADVMQAMSSPLSWTGVVVSSNVPETPQADGIARKE